VRVRRAFFRKGDLQHAQTFAVLIPRVNLSRIEADVGVEVRRCEYPQSA
jgi:hypothetical protein